MDNMVEVFEMAGDAERCLVCGSRMFVDAKGVLWCGECWDEGEEEENEIEVGDTITLRGLTQHGRNRINQHGDKWLVKKIEFGSVFVESTGDTFSMPGGKVKDSRWVDISWDKDFSIVEG